jgi:Arc/MetJ-type ribon-helix-helix transcriptional regulator
MAELTPIRIEKQLKVEIKELISQGYFSTLTEFVKDSIRKNLENYRKQQAFKVLNELKGSSKTTKKQTKTTRAKIVSKYLNSNRDILKEYELK